MILKIFYQKKKGAGFYIWKYDIIKQKLNEINNNDILIYLDSGCSINKHGQKRFYEYIDLINKSKNPIISFQMKGLKEKTWTTKKIFEYFKINKNNDIINSDQYVGGILLMKKCDFIVNLFNQFEKLLYYDPYLITDKYNDNCYPGFKQNRHDQSILSLLRKINGSIIIQDETYFHKKWDSDGKKYPIHARRRLIK